MNIKTLSVVLVLLAPTAQAGDYYSEVALGTNVSQYMPWSQGQSGGFSGATDTVRFTIRKEVTKSLYVGYSHISHLSVGWPVNNKQEDWLDVVEVGYQFKL